MDSTVRALAQIEPPVHFMPSTNPPIITALKHLNDKLSVSLQIIICPIGKIF